MYPRNLRSTFPDSGPPVLPSGTFFGCSTVEREAGGLLLALRDADPHRVIETHTHEDAHFVLVLDGAYHTSAREVSSAPGGPLLVYNPPGTTHRDHFAARGDRFAGRFFTLSTSASLEDRGLRTESDDGGARALEHPLALAIARALARECERWDAVSSTQAEGLGLELLSLMARAPSATAGSAPAWLHRVLEQLHDRATEAVSIGQLAADAGVHPVYLARCFRKFVGCSPGDLLRRRRVERAVALLQRSPRSIAQIAAECRFVDQSHLTRALQRHSGVTPASYRRHPMTATRT